MIQVKEIILNLKDKESITKEQLWMKLREVLDAEINEDIEYLRKKAECYYPKTDVITRID